VSGKHHAFTVAQSSSLLLLGCSTRVPQFYQDFLSTSAEGKFLLWINIFTKSKFCRLMRFMLNLNAMQALATFFVAMISLLVPLFTLQQADGDFTLTNPKPEDVLQGVIHVTGQVKGQGIASYEVSFGYQEDPRNTWFLLAQGTHASDEGTLAVWDTNLISDGNYRLVLRVFFIDGRQEEMVISDLRVRNYTIVETATAPWKEETTPVPPTVPADPSLPPVQPTATAFALNPGTVTQGDVVFSLTRGAGFAAIFFILLGTYLTLRRRSRR